MITFKYDVSTNFYTFKHIESDTTTPRLHMNDPNTTAILNSPTVILIAPYLHAYLNFKKCSSTMNDDTVVKHPQNPD